MFIPEDFFGSLSDADKERCWEAIGTYGEEAEEPSFFLIEISEESLKQKDFDDTELIDFCDLGFLDAFKDTLSAEEIEKLKADFGEVTSFVVALYCGGQYVTSAQGE